MTEVDVLPGEQDELVPGFIDPQRIHVPDSVLIQVGEDQVPLDLADQLFALLRAVDDTILHQLLDEKRRLVGEHIGNVRFPCLLWCVRECHQTILVKSAESSRASAISVLLVGDPARQITHVEHGFLSGIGDRAGAPESPAQFSIPVD